MLKLAENMRSKLIETDVSAEEYVLQYSEYPCKIGENNICEN